MTDEEYGKRYTNLVRLYRSNPNAFSPDDVDRIEQLANSLGRRFNRNIEASEEGLGKQIGDMLGQFGSGLVSGFTTIPFGEDPEDVGEAIARSIGQLMGFIGVVPGLGTATKVGTTAAAKILTRASGIAGKQGASKLSAGLRLGSMKAAKTPSGALRGKSLPMYIGGKALGYAQKYALPTVENKALQYLSKGTVDKLKDATETAIQLGTASAVSSWSGGIDQVIRGGLLGAVEGGVFRGITNMTQLGGMLAKGGVDAKQANVAIRTISSSLYGGLQSKAFGDPIELQIYHYLLGAYFGVTDIPYTQRKAVEFINKSRNLTPEEAQAGLTERMLNPEMNPGFKDLTPEVQQEVTEQMDMMFGRPGDASEIFSRALKDVLSEEDKQELIRIKANQKVEEFMDEGLDFEEAKAKAYQFIKDKNVGDLLREEDFVVTGKDVVSNDYNPFRGANVSNADIMRLSFDDHEIPSVLVDPLTSFTEGLMKNVPTATSDIALYVGKKIVEGTKEQRSFESIIKDIEDGIFNEYKIITRLDRRPEEINQLKKAYLKIDQYKPVKQITYNPNAEGQKFSLNTGRLSDNTRSIENKGISAIEEAVNSFTDANGNKLDIIVSKNVDNLNGFTDDLYKQFFDELGLLSDGRVTDYLIDAANEGVPVLFGKKDSGNLYHSNGWLDPSMNDDNPTTWQNLLSQKIDLINEADPDLNVSLIGQEQQAGTEAQITPEYLATLKSLKINEDSLYDLVNRGLEEEGFAGALEELPSTQLSPSDAKRIETLQKYQLNNILLLERLNGLTIDQMVRANKDGSGSFITRPDEINKRMQPLADGNPRLMDLPEVFRQPINAFIINSTNSQDVAKKIDFDEVNNDGITLVSERLFDAIKKVVGGTEKDGFIKFTIAGKQGDNNGMLIGKLGAFQADGSAAKIMKENNADILFYDTAVKQRGLRKQTSVIFGEDGITPVEGEAIETFSIDPSTIRVNLGVYEKAPKKTRMVKQFMSLLTNPQARQRIIDNVIKPSIEGNKELSDRAIAGKIIDDEAASINVDELSLGAITKILFQPNSDRLYGNRLYSKIWEHILNEVGQEDFLDASDLKGEAGTIEALLPEVLISDFNSSSDRIIKVVSKYNGLTPDIMNQEQVSLYANEALKRYMFNRAVRPKIKNSGSTFIYGNDMFLQRDLGRPVKKGTYMFAKNMKDFQIKWIDGKQISLGKAWNLYQKESSAEQRKKMEQAMEFIVVRVPQDSPSGARALRFDGFTSRNGYGMHLNAYDMKYLGGADNDGDKVHFYQDLDGDLGGSPIRDAVLAVKDQWTDAKGNVRDAKESVTIKQFEAQREAATGKKTLKNSLDPREILKTHLYTTDGNRLVGPVANAAATSTGFFSGFNQKIKGFNSITFDSAIPFGENNNFIVGARINKISKSLTEFDRLRREMQNVAVDATDQTPYNIRNAISTLSKKLFTSDDVTLIDKDGKDISFDDTRFTQASFNKALAQLNLNKVDGVKDLVKINETINGRRFDRETEKSTLIPFSQAMTELNNFSSKYKNADLGNAYWSAVQELGSAVSGNYSKVVKDPSYKNPETNQYERYYPSQMARYVRLNINKIIDIVNAYTKSTNDAEYSDVLVSSGQKRLNVLKEGVDPYRSVSDVRQLEESVRKISSLYHNDVAYKAALKAGVSKEKLRGIRKHIDSFKYSRNKFMTTDKTTISYQRNLMLKDKELNIKTETLDELFDVTAEYKKGLKTNEEKDYYDFYMLGSLSEQRFNIDDIARMEYIRRSRDMTYDEAEKLINNSEYDAYTYEHIKSEEFISVNPGLKDLYKVVNRLYDNDVGGNVGFTVPAVSDVNIAKYFATYTDIISAKKDARMETDVLDPSTSAFVEKLLLRNISEEKAREVTEKITSELKKSDYNFPAQEGDIISVLGSFYKHDTNRPPKDRKEARRSAIADEVINQRITDDLFSKIFKDSSDDLFDEATELGKRNSALRKELQGHLSKLPSNIVKNIERIYEGYVRKEVGVSTVNDVDNFITFLNSFHKKTFLEELVGADPSKNISRIYWLFFPDSIARRLTQYDPNLSASSIVQVLTKDGYKSKEVNGIMSHYEQMRLFLGTVEENRSALVNVFTSRINDELSYLNDESVANDKEDLVEAALAIKEYNNVTRERKILNDPNATEEQKRNAQWSIKQYQDNFDRIQENYERLKDKKYLVYINGVKQQVLGKDLMGDTNLAFINKGMKMKDGMISKSFTRLNNLFFDTIINPEEANKFVIRRADGSLDAIATLNKMEAQFQGTKFESERIANIGLSNLFELSKELEYYYNTEVNVNGKKMFIKDIDDVDLQNKKLSELRLAERGRLIGNGPDGPVYKRNPDGTFVLNPMIGKQDPVNYMPHVNHSDDAIKAWQKEFILEKNIGDVTDREYTAFKKWAAQGKVEDMGMAKEYIERLFVTKAFIPKSRDTKTTMNKFGNLAGRSDRIIGGWELSIKAYDQYAQSLNSAYHKLYGTIMAQKYNRQFRESNVMGDITESWAKFGDIYIQDFVGKPSSFDDSYFADPYLNFKKSPYYALSDDMAQKYYNRIAKFFGWKQYADNEVDSAEFQNKMKAFSRLEGKAQLITLLTNTTSMVNNYVGGTAQTAISSGLRPWRLAGSWTYLRDNIDPSIDSYDKAMKMAMEFGAIESYLSNEVGPSAQIKSSGKKFISDLTNLYKSGNFSKKQVIDIAKKHNMSEVIAGPGAWMMSSVEVRLRTRSFWAHYLQAREVMMADGSSFRWDDPVLIQQALKGVWGSQFMYNAPNRPAIARSNLGRIFARFQLWSWNSIRFRRDIYQRARESGFQEGTPEYQRFVRMAQADAFMFALAALMPMSMFDNTLASPWNYLLDFTDYFFGDEDERDRAFFGQIPYPFNPLQLALPPSSRYITTGVSVPIEMAIAMLSDKDLSDALDYRVVSLLPYGLLSRNIVRSLDTPAMAPQYLTGIHFHTLTRLMNKMQDSATLKANGLYEAKTRYVDEEIEKLLEYMQSMEQ